MNILFWPTTSVNTFDVVSPLNDPIIKQWVRVNVEKLSQEFYRPTFVRGYFTKIRKILFWNCLAVFFLVIVSSTTAPENVAAKTFLCDPTKQHQYGGCSFELNLSASVYLAFSCKPFALNLNLITALQQFVNQK